MITKIRKSISGISCSRSPCRWRILDGSADGGTGFGVICGFAGGGHFDHIAKNHFDHIANWLALSDFQKTKIKRVVRYMAKRFSLDSIPD